MRHILVAVDETDASRRAAAFVDGFFRGQNDIEALAREEANGRAVATAQAPRDADIEVAIGETVEAIERAAEDERADLIVVGSNDKTFLQRLIGGSVSQQLARHRTRPILIVP